MDAYSTYRRCTLRSLRLAAVYWTLSGVLAVYVLYTAITSKNHLLQEVLSTDAVLFARFEEEKDKRPKCAEMNATGLCVELPWLDAVEVSASRGFLATYMEEALFLGRPALQRLGAPVESQQPRKVRSQGFYVGQPELWSLVLEDRLASIAGTWSSQDLAGFMREDQLDGSYSHPIEYAANGLPKEVRVKIGGHKNQMDRRVKVSMSELLSAVNVTLDQGRCVNLVPAQQGGHLRAAGPGAAARGGRAHHSERRRGTVLLRRDGLQWYKARPSACHSQKLRHSGVIGRWDPMTLAFFCLQSCTFLGVAWTLTELLCTFIPILCDLRGRPAPAWLESLQRAPREKKE